MSLSSPRHCSKTLSLSHTVTIFAANHNGTPRSCRDKFIHEWWRKCHLNRTNCLNCLENLIDGNCNGSQNVISVTKKAAANQIELSPCRTKHKKLRRHTYKAYLLAMCNEAVEIRTNGVYVQRNKNELARHRTNYHFAVRRSTNCNEQERIAVGPLYKDPTKWWHFKRGGLLWGVKYTMICK